ncbi:MAG: hypothetical protein F4086_04785 [Gemmatimonadetes bacterium]|nr:hypothetical protein [Gemmatimonadota bacterium]
MLKYVMIFLVVLSQFGCDDMSNANKVIDTIDSDSPSEMQPVETDVESPFDKVPPEEPQQPTVREYDFDVQTITARNISSQSLGITDPNKRGVISINSNVKALYITSDDTIVEVTNTRCRILPPNTPELEDYEFLPFYDANGNATVLVGDVVEVIQHELSTRIIANFRIVRNITRPEVDYSDFWVSE